MPIAGFGIVETVLGVAILGFVSMLGTFAIAGTGISKELPIKKQKKTYDGVTPLDEQNARGLERTQADLKQNKPEASPSAPLHSILRNPSAKATSSKAKTGGVEF